jgi:hypothetical protein
MATVTVTLDITAQPPVTMTPPQLDIDSGAETIHWTPARGSTFTFAALVFNDRNPFCNVVVTDTEITARDSNQAKEEHPYNVLVKANGTYYSSAIGITGGGNGPTIRNN